MRIKICQISTVHGTFDDRIFHKQCVYLAKAGFDVNLVVKHSKKETVNGVNIIPLKDYNSRTARFFIGSFVAFRKALKTKSKIYQIHDPELLFVAFWLKLLGKKVVFDMHELIYAQIYDKDWIGNKSIIKFIANIYKFLEKRAVKKFDAILLAEDGYKKYIEDNYLKFIDKFKYIRNFSVISLIDPIPPINKTDNKVVLLYAGGITQNRGIKQIIIGIRDIPNLKFQILGSWESKTYKEECIKEDVNQQVEYIGQVPLEKVYEYMKSADIGIANLYPIENYLTSLPVKAFEYMACKLPIIMSNFPYWIEKFSTCALFVDPKKPNDIYQKLVTLVTDEKLRRELGERGRELVIEKYSWEAEAEKLINLYNKLSAH